MSPLRGGKEGVVGVHSLGLSEGLSDLEVSAGVSQRKRAGKVHQPRGNNMFKGPEARERKPHARN